MDVPRSFETGGRVFLHQLENKRGVVYTQEHVRMPYVMLKGIDPHTPFEHWLLTGIYRVRFSSAHPVCEFQRGEVHPNVVADEWIRGGGKADAETLAFGKAVWAALQHGRSR